MIEKNKVTIIIPVYNSAAFIEETINSCLRQTYKAVEIIVIDDCSTDGTIDYLKNVNGITLYMNSENKGISKNLNFAVRECSGDYVIFLGHDDILPCTHVEKMIIELSTENQISKRII